MSTRILTLTVLLAAVAAAAAGLYLGSRDGSSPAQEAGAQLTTRVTNTGSAAEGSQLAVPSGKIGAQGLSIAEARSAETPENLLVRGFLVTRGKGLVLCEEPSCDGDQLTVGGEPGIAPDGPEAVTLLGTIEGDKLVAVNLAAA